MEDTPDATLPEVVRGSVPGVHACAWFSLRAQAIDHRKPPPKGFVLHSPAVVAVDETSVHVLDVRWPGPSVRRLGSWSLSDVAVSQVRTRSARIALPGAATAFDLRPEHSGAEPAAVVSLLAGRAANVTYDATDAPFPIPARLRIVGYSVFAGIEAVRAIVWSGDHPEAGSPASFAVQIVGVWILASVVGEIVTAAVARHRSKDDLVAERR